jgi:hypothetical protein
VIPGLTFGPPARLLTVVALAALLVLFGVDPARSQAQTGLILVSHDFTSSTQGWRISGDSSTTDPIFSPTGGNPGGCITGVDEALGETWYFRAPTTVLTQLPAAENGTISYSLKQSSNMDGGFLDDDVIIVGTAGRIGYRFGFGSGPGTAWKDYSVQLSASAGWRWNLGPPATQAQIRSVLAAPVSLDVRGEFVTGPDEGSLDNFMLTAAPARGPASSRP